MTIEERARVVTECRPEMATFNCGSFNFGIFKARHRPEMAPWEIEYLESHARLHLQEHVRRHVPARRAVPRGGHQARVRGLRRRPPLQPRAPRRGGPRRLPDPRAVRARRARARTRPRSTSSSTCAGPPRSCSARDGFTWSAAGVGYPGQFHLAAAALMIGGHMRVGLEDNLRVRADRRADSNAELVEKAMALARAARPRAGRRRGRPRAARARALSSGRVRPQRVRRRHQVRAPSPRPPARRRAPERVEHRQVLLGDGDQVGARAARRSRTCARRARGTTTGARASCCARRARSRRGRPRRPATARARRPRGAAAIIAS